MFSCLYLFEFKMTISVVTYLSVAGTCPKLLLRLGLFTSVVSNMPHEALRHTICIPRWLALTSKNNQKCWQVTEQPELRNVSTSFLPEWVYWSGKLTKWLFQVTISCLTNSLNYHTFYSLQKQMRSTTVRPTHQAWFEIPGLHDICVYICYWCF